MPILKKKRKSGERRNPIEWYRDNESWVWRIALVLLGMANLWLCSKFVSQDMYWKNYREENCRISQNERDIEILKERTHR